MSAFVNGEKPAKRLEILLWNESRKRPRLSLRVIPESVRFDAKHLLKLLEAMAKTDPRMVGGLLAILRSHLRCETFSLESLERLVEALNLPVKIVKEEYRSSEFGARRKLVTQCSPMRKAGEQILDYLEFFYDHANLWESRPIAVCANKRCADGGKFFVKGKGHQAFCCDKCRVQAWQDEKLKEDPDYLRRKAKRNRTWKRRNQRIRLGKDLARSRS
jgi:hypothetical protein